MFESLQKYITDRAPIDPLALQEICSHFTPVSVRKNQIMTAMGDTCQYIYFVKKGGLRFYYLDKKGDEATRYFALENTFGTAFASFIHAEPSIEYMQAIEASELLAIHRAPFYDLVNRIQPFAFIYRQILELAYTYSVKRIGSFIAMDSAERLNWLLTNQPHLLQRVPNNVIASYLGIKRETLSRLLARTRKR